MEFINYSCPVCKQKFQQGEDVVVCPECGTPHHRICYEINNKCFFDAKHKEGYVFNLDNEKEDNSKNEEKTSGFDSQQTSGETNSDVLICPNCKQENDKTHFYCKKCGFPLLNNQNQNSNNGPTFFYGNVNPNDFQNMGNPQFIIFDPMAGFKSTDKFAENVNAGEIAKFVGKNTNYFMRVFGSILKIGRSRFNLSAFIFSGIYYLYRKMYGIGMFLSLTILAMTVCTMAIEQSSRYQELYQMYMSIMDNGSYFASATEVLNEMSQKDFWFFAIPSFLSLLKTVIMFVVGFTANRTYYRFSIKKIKKVKSNLENSNIVDETKVKEAIETKGGVNSTLAIVASIVYLVVLYLPEFM